MRRVSSGPRRVPPPVPVVGRTEKGRHGHQPGERNQMDQRMLEHGLWEGHTGWI